MASSVERDRFRHLSSGCLVYFLTLQRPCSVSCIYREREKGIDRKRGGKASLFLSVWTFIECHAASVWQEMLGVMAGFWRWLGQLLKALEQREIIAYDGLIFPSALHHQHASLSLSPSIHFFSWYTLMPTRAIYYGELKSSSLLSEHSA